MSTTTWRSRPEGHLSGIQKVRQPESSLPDTAAHSLSQFGIRMVQEAMCAAVPHTWERRADTLEDARPRPDDFHGNATPAELAERDRRLAEQVAACRLHAEFLRLFPDVLAETIAADVEALMRADVGVA